MEIEQKERERIEKAAHEYASGYPDYSIGEGYKAGAAAEHIYLQKEVIQPLRKDMELFRESAKDMTLRRDHYMKKSEELEAENKALREELGNTMASVEQYGAVPEKQNLINHQLLTKNVVKPGDAELNATTDL